MFDEHCKQTAKCVHEIIVYLSRIICVHKRILQDIY